MTPSSTSPLTGPHVHESSTSPQLSATDGVDSSSRSSASSPHGPPGRSPMHSGSLALSAGGGTSLPVDTRTVAAESDVRTTTRSQVVEAPSSADVALRSHASSRPSPLAIPELLHLILSFIPAESASFDARLLRVNRAFHAALSPRFYRVLVLSRSQASCERFVAGCRDDDILARRKVIDRLEIDVDCFDPCSWGEQALGLLDDDDDDSDSGDDDYPTPLAHLRQQLEVHRRLWSSVTTLRLTGGGNLLLEDFEAELEETSMDVSDIVALCRPSRLILECASGRFLPLLYVRSSSGQWSSDVCSQLAVDIISVMVLSNYRRDVEAFPSPIALLRPLPVNLDARTGAPHEFAEIWLELLLDVIDANGDDVEYRPHKFLHCATLDLVPLLTRIVCAIPDGQGAGTDDLKNDDNGALLDQLCGWALVQRLCIDYADELGFETLLPEGLDLACFLPKSVDSLGLVLTARAWVGTFYAPADDEDADGEWSGGGFGGEWALP